MSEPATTKQPTQGVSYLYVAAAFVVVVAGMKAAESIVNPLLLAIFLSVISAPAYFKLLARGVSDWLALLTVIGVLAIAMFAVIFFVTKSIAGFTSQQQHYQDRLQEERNKLLAVVDRWTPEWATPAPTTPKPKHEGTGDDNTALDTTATETTPAELDEDASQEQQDVDDAEADTESTGQKNADTTEAADRNLVLTAEQQRMEKQTWTEYLMDQFDPGTAINWAGAIALSLSQLLSNAILILLTVIFILLEAGGFSRKMNNAFTQSSDASERAKRIVASVQHYIVIKTWVSLATGLLIGFWLKAWGVSHAPLWGLLAFLFNYIPNVGSILAAIPAVLVAWLDLTWQPAAACAVGFAVVNGAIGNFIEPRLMGKSLGLSPLVIFCSMIFWGWVLGPIGMLLSVPLTMTARIAMDGFEDTKWMATLMGN